MKIEQLNLSAYSFRVTNPNKTISTGKSALTLAKKINFELGMAEAYRVIGIGYSYINKSDTAVANFSLSLTIFKSKNNLEGEAKVYNNIGNLYRYYDYNKALHFYDKCLKISEKINLEELTAGCNINIAYILVKQKKYPLALKTLNKSYDYFKTTNNNVGLTLILLNKGLIYKDLNNRKEAKFFLQQAHDLAKQNNLYNSLASINLTLASIYIGEKNLEKARYLIDEGVSFAKLYKDKKLEEDFLHSYYELEYAQKNYKAAFSYLREVFMRDSIAFNQLESKKITLHKEQYDFIQKQKETEVLLERQKTNKVTLVATIIVLILSLAVIALLIIQSRKKTKTYQQLKELNEEISLQKENLNRVNQNQEQIIKERTQDLEQKNVKLSQYSSHLSHEIRSPIATIKGLLILEKEDLIDDKELIEQIGKSVEEIDTKLININHMLHNPQYKTFTLEKDDTPMSPKDE